MTDDDDDRRIICSRNGNGINRGGKVLEAANTRSNRKKKNKATAMETKEKSNLAHSKKKKQKTTTVKLTGDQTTKTGSRKKNEKYKNRLKKRKKEDQDDGEGDEENRDTVIDVTSLPHQMPSKDADQDSGQQDEEEAISRDEFTTSIVVDVDARREADRERGGRNVDLAYPSAHTDEAEEWYSMDDDVTTDDEDEFLLGTNGSSRQRGGSRSQHSNASSNASSNWRKEFIKLRNSNRLKSIDDTHDNIKPLSSGRLSQRQEEAEGDDEANDDGSRPQSPSLYGSDDDENAPPRSIVVVDVGDDNNTNHSSIDVDVDGVENNTNHSSIYSVSFHDDIRNSQQCLFGGQSEIGHSSHHHHLMGSTIGLRSSNGSRHSKTPKPSSSVHSILSTSSLPREDTTVLKTVLGSSSDGSSEDDESFALDGPLSKHDKTWEYRLTQAAAPTADRNSHASSDDEVEEIERPESTRIDMRRRTVDVSEVDMAQTSLLSREANKRNKMNDDDVNDNDSEARLFALQLQAEEQRGDPSNYDSHDDDGDVRLVDFCVKSQITSRHFKDGTELVDDEDDNLDDSLNWQASAIKDIADLESQALHISFRSSSSRTGLDPPEENASNQRDKRTELREDLEAQVAAQFSGQDERLKESLHSLLRRKSSKKAVVIEGQHDNDCDGSKNSMTIDDLQKSPKSTKSVPQVSTTSRLTEDGNNESDLHDKEVKKSNRVVEIAAGAICTYTFVYAMTVTIFLLLICVIVLIVYFVKERQD